jgi:hypothetical protein
MRRLTMRKTLVLILTVGLVVLVPAAPASAKHTRKRVNHIHLTRSKVKPDDMVNVNSRMYTGKRLRCKNDNDVIVKSSGFRPYESKKQAVNHWVKGRWRFVDPGKHMLRMRCKGVLFKAKFRVRKSDLAYTGVPVLPTAGVGLGLTVIGWLMLLAAGPGPGRGPRRRVVSRRAVRRRSGGRAPGSDTLATRPR